MKTIKKILLNENLNFDFYTVLIYIGLSLAFFVGTVLLLALANVIENF